MGCLSLYQVRNSALIRLQILFASARATAQPEDTSFCLPSTPCLLSFPDPALDPMLRQLPEAPASAQATLTLNPRGKQAGTLALQNWVLIDSLCSRDCAVQLFNSHLSHLSTFSYHRISLSASWKNSKLLHAQCVGRAGELQFAVPCSLPSCTTAFFFPLFSSFIYLFFIFIYIFFSFLSFLHF